MIGYVLGFVGTVVVVQKVVDRIHHYNMWRTGVRDAQRVAPHAVYRQRLLDTIDPHEDCPRRSSYNRGVRSVIKEENHQ